MNLAWRIGEVTVTRIVETELPFAYHPKHPFMPAATPEALSQIPWLHPNYVTPEGALRLSVHALLVEAPGLRLIVDTCIGNDKPSAITRNESLHTGFLEDLLAAGWPVESVDTVVCTHLHVDHVGWNTRILDGKWVPTFPHAKYLIGEIEYAHWQADESAGQQQVMSSSVQPIFDAGLAQLVPTDHQISPEVSLVPTIGHTPGHVSVKIESQGQQALITGDFVHNPCQIAQPDWTVSFDDDQAAAARCRHRLFRDLVGTDTLVIGTHFAAPTAGKIVADGDTYRLESSD